MKTSYYIQYIFLMAVLVGTLSCADEESLTPDYQAPSELPDYLVRGTALNNAILDLYDDLGVVVYTDPSDPRFSKDLVSSESLVIADREPADTEAAMLYIKMIKEELFEKLPAEKKYLTPRNFYFLKNDLVSGSGFFKYAYRSYLWYNSFADLTVGGLNNTTVDSTFLKGSLYYGLASILRGQPENTNYYSQFVTATDDGGYYWSVTNIDAAYSAGFLSADQNEIRSDQQDFDLYGAWGATVDPAERDSLFSIYPLLARKYSIVSGMFRSNGIPLEDINADWQQSQLNPKNN